MCGGGDDKVGKEANRMEQERRAQIATTTGKINQVFDNPDRQKQYDDFLNSTRSYYTSDINRQNEEATRGLKFAMARNGQTGGSVAADNGFELGTKYQRGLIDAERAAQGDTSNLRNRDADSRLQLISLASQGLDATTASNQAAMAMRNNLSIDKAGMQVAGLGNIFGNFADMFEKSRRDAETRRGEKYVYDLLYGNNAARR